MNCQEMIDFIVDYLDGVLPEDQREHFEGHLQLCPPCVRYLQDYRQTIELCRAACRPLEAPPAAPPPQLVQAILAAARRPQDA